MARTILHGFSMIEKTLLAFWGVWLLLILAAALRVFGFSIARRLQDRRWGDGSGPQKPVALILSAKGFDLQATPRFFDTMFAQTYGDYRVIVCFESWEDPVAVWLCEHLERNAEEPVWTHPDPTKGLRSITLVCGGLAEDEGQKVHNQRAAFAELTPGDAIIAFADADILCGRDWLARLVAPINRGKYELATTYRWLIPRRPTLPNQLASVINASIATQGGAEWSTVLWGGSMAMTRAVFDKIDAPNLLAGSLNDDLRLSKAARATGRRIAFVRSLILPTYIDFTWRSFFEFARRQYTQLKFFSPILYTGANIVFGFYMLGLASLVAALVYGYFYAWVPVFAAYVIDQFRAVGRLTVYLSLYKDPSIRQKLFATCWLEHMFTPVWISLHWLLLFSTWTQRRITWAGVRYRILSKSKTRILGRKSITPPLPAGTPGLALITELHDRRRSDFSISAQREGAALASPAAAEDLPSPAVAEREPIASLWTEAIEEKITVPEASRNEEALEPCAPSQGIPPSFVRAIPPLARVAPPTITPLSQPLSAPAARRPLAVLRSPHRTDPPRLETLLRKARARGPHPGLSRFCVTVGAPPLSPWSPGSDALPAAAPPSGSAAPHRLLSALEIALRKTDTGRAQPAPGEASSPEAPRTAGEGPASPIAGRPPLSFPSLSAAARRVGPGRVHRASVVPSRQAALSARSHPAPRRAGLLPTRPHSRGPSARPR